MQIVDPMSLKALLFGRQGRIGRRRWWLWGVAMPIGMGLYFTVLLRVAGVAPRSTDILVNLLLFWPTLAVSVKRWHDRGKSGWWVLIALVPVIGWVWVLIENGLLRGDAGPNRFGEPEARSFSTSP